MTYRSCFVAAMLLTTLAPPFATAANAVEQLRDFLKAPAVKRGDVAEQPFAAVPLTKAEAEAAATLLRDDRLATLRTERAAEWTDKALVRGDKTMRFNTKSFGTKPAGGWNLLIVLHGGGNTQPAVNDQQWSGMHTLYTPTNTLTIAPRAPTDTWNLWHEPHIDPMLDRLIEDAVLFGGVDPDHVYLTGYSAGGDGVYQLAPRMADRFAAAAMMAGHPNDASPLSLRNLPFAIHVGALDAAYRRNDVARDWGGKLDALQKSDPAGYTHQVQLHDGRGHWMNREDATAIGWMQTFARQATPKKIVWEQGNVPHDRFYWLAVPTGQAKRGQLIVASREGQTVTIQQAKGVPAVRLLLGDEAFDLDKPLRVVMNGRDIYYGTPPRKIADLDRSIADRPVDSHIAAASVLIELPR